MEISVVRKSFGLMSLACLAAVWGTSVSPKSLAAQRNRSQNLKKLLIVPAMSESAGDSAYSVAVADEFRRRTGGKLRNRMRVFTTDEYCEALEASGFPCTTLLDNTAAEQLARFMSADAYVVGQLSRSSGVPSMTIRMVDIGRSGLAGRALVRGAAGDEADDFAEAAADTVRNQERAAEQVQQCSDRRDRGDLNGARDRAERAFEMYPNHPAAALCVSYLFEASQQPIDSMIWIYRKVVAGDPAWERGWERLGRLYFEQGDTVQAIEAFGGQLEAVPNNDDLRVQIAGMWAEIDSLNRALQVLEGGVQEDPEKFLSAETTLCVEAEDWDCALETYTRRYDLDNDLGKDREFLQQIIGAADFASDTAAAVRWTGLAVAEYPDEIPFLQNHAAWLKGAGMTDSALTVFYRVSELDPSSTQALLAIVSTMQDELVIDTMTPLDTNALITMDSILTIAAERAGDNQAVLSNIGALYLRPGIQMAQQRIHPRVAADWLARSLEFPIPDGLKPQANFFLGFITIFYLGDVFAEVQAAQSCDAVQMYEKHVMRGKNGLIEGRSISPETADRLLQDQYSRFEEVIPQFREVWQCAQVGNR